MYHKKLFTQQSTSCNCCHGDQRTHRPRPLLIQHTCPSCTCHHRVFAPGHTRFHFSRPLAT